MVNNDIDKLLLDAQTLTYNHVVKADNILEQPLSTTKKKFTECFMKLIGNVATNAQFYATDSTKKFHSRSVYFMQNLILILFYQLQKYLKDDMRRIMETLEWK